MNGDVPERVWSGKNVCYAHLNVFRCKAFVHVLKDERPKLDVKTRKYIFVGYGQDEFGYCFFDPVEKKLVRSCDVASLKEDQTLQYLDKAVRVDSQTIESLVNVDPVPLAILLVKIFKLILKMVIIFRMTRMSLMLQCKTM